MADNINNLDKLFKSNLANHAVTPEPMVWDKLSNRLDRKEKVVVLIWWKWMAAAAVVLISFWLMYQHEDPTSKNIASVSVSDTKIIEKNPFSISPMPIIIESEKSADKIAKEETNTNTREIKAPNRNLVAKEEKVGTLPVSEAKPTIKRTREQLAPIFEDDKVQKTNGFTAPLLSQQDVYTTIALEEGKKNANNDYKVKIISNGYAIQPEKEKLVEELESKIGGFFTKMDEGFGGLQDAKNNLFASLTTKRDKKKN